MPKLKIINNISEINLDDSWVSAATFKSKDRLVDENGKKVGSDYCSRKYRLVEKRERHFSRVERISRAILGIASILFSLGLTLFDKRLSLDLLKKSKQTIRYALLDGDTPFMVENGKVLYLKPQLLLQDCVIAENQVLNLALIKSNKKQQVVPIVKAFSSASFEIFSGSIFDALYIFERNSVSPLFYQKSAIRLFLDFMKTCDGQEKTSVQNTERALASYFFEKDDTGTPRICLIGQEGVLEILKIIESNNLALDPDIAKTLFNRSAGKGPVKLTELLLELAPSVIDDIKDQSDSPFSKAVLEKSKDECALLLKAIDSRKVSLSIQDNWLKRILTNDASFSDDEFNALDTDLKRRIFYAANAYENIDLVERLKTLGMGDAPVFLNDAHILAINMDVVTAKKTIKDFLLELKQNEELVSAESFYHDLKGVAYITKSDQIDRIQGTRFIKKIAEANGIKYIKVPKKIAVIERGVNTLTFRIGPILQILPKPGQLTIQAERITAVKRKLSLEEAIEFMIMLEKTGYSDFMGDNFIIAKDGVYFIDTEFKDFDPNNPSFEAIESIKMLIAPEDKEAFLKEFQKRKAAWHSNEKEKKEKARQSFLAVSKNRYNRLVDGYGYFNFSLDELVPQNKTTP